MLGGKLPRTRLFWIAIGVLVVFLGVGAFFALRMSSAVETQVVAFSQFLQDVDAKQVSKVVKKVRSSRKKVERALKRG